MNLKYAKRSEDTEQISIIEEECGIDMDNERRELRTVIK
nr:MAG TPA: hypothetical protein [Caudoviricetes sp.]